LKNDLKERFIVIEMGNSPTQDDMETDGLYDLSSLNPSQMSALAVKMLQEHYPRNAELSLNVGRLFLQYHVCGQTFIGVTDEDLKEIGVELHSHRAFILHKRAEMAYNSL
jgi:hypothetical protein